MLCVLVYIIKYILRRTNLQKPCLTTGWEAGGGRWDGGGPAEASLRGTLWSCEGLSWDMVTRDSATPPVGGAGSLGTPLDGSEIALDRLFLFFSGGALWFSKLT